MKELLKEVGEFVESLTVEQVEMLEMLFKSNQMFGEDVPDGVCELLSDLGIICDERLAVCMFQDYGDGQCEDLEYLTVSDYEFNNEYDDEYEADEWEHHHEACVKVSILKDLVCLGK